MNETTAPTLTHSPPLLPAVMRHKAELSQQDRDDIQALAGPRPIQFLTQAVLAWAIIFGSIYAAEQIGALWATLIAIFLVASRMNILGLLVHEQAHFLGFRGKWADLIANMLTAYPLMVLTIEGYAKVHLSHHRFYFTDKDPDLQRKSGPDWTFPMPGWHLAKLFLSDITGLSIVKLVRGKRLEANVFHRPHPIPKWVRPAFILGILGLITVFGAWKLFLIYWLIPLLFVFPVIVRLGAIAEHVYIPGGDVAETSPLLIQQWYEKLLLPNLNFAMHPYHHWYPGVAWCHLPDIHRIYQRAGWVNEANVFHGYAHYLRHLQTAQPLPV
ncbi:MAG: fatty acid desaturase [Burkholderiales bacterium]|nr:fatty acid desaturase [Burkholderiales bacterium]